MPLSNLLTDLLQDINKPVILWQAGIIAVCAVLGWSLARLVRGAYAQPEDGSGGVVHAGVANFGHVLTPIFIASLIAIAKLIALPLLGNVNLLRVALPLAGSLAVIRMAFYLLRRVFARRGHLGAALVTFEKIFALLVWLGVALYLTGLWADVFAFLDSTTVPLGKNKVALSTIGQAAVSVAVLLMLALWAGAALEERLMGVSGLHTSLRVVMARMSRAVLIVVAVLLSLSLVGIDLTVLSVFGGALGVGLGLGMQKIASNYVSGFIVLFDRSVRVGDRVNVNNFNGYVTKITTRYTVVKDANGAEALVPNENFIANMVINESYSGKALWRTIPIQVAYNTDLSKALAIMKAAAEKQERVRDEASATLAGFADSGINLNVGFWVKDPENGFSLLNSNIMMDIWQQFNEAGIEFPYPQREIRIINNELAAETPPPKVHIPTSKEATISNEPSSAQPQPDGASGGDNK